MFEHPAERATLIQEAKAGQIILVNYGILGSLPGAQVPSLASMVLDEAQQIRMPAPSVPNCCSSSTGFSPGPLPAPHREPPRRAVEPVHLHQPRPARQPPGEFKRRFGKAVKDPRHMAMLRAVISPFILRRLKQQVLTELPDKTEIIHHISLSRGAPALRGDKARGGAAGAERRWPRPDARAETG